MDEKQFRKQYRGWSNEFELFDFLKDVWKDRLAYLSDKGYDKQYFHLTNLLVKVNQHSSGEEKGSASLWLMPRLSRKMPGVNMQIAFSRADGPSSSQWQGDDTLSRAIKSSPTLQTASSELLADPLLKAFGFRVRDTDLFREAYTLTSMGLDQAVKLKVKEDRFAAIAAAANRLLEMTNGALLGTIFCSAKFDVVFDKWSALLSSGKDPATIFNKVLGFVQQLAVYVNQLGFEPAPSHRRLLDLETEKEYPIRTSARQQLLEPIHRYLALGNPLSPDNAKQLSQFYQTIDAAYKQWKTLRIDEDSSAKWNKERLTAVYLGYRRAGIRRREGVDSKSDSPYKGLAERAQKGKTLDEKEVAEFLNAVLEWLGPGEYLGDPQLNLTLSQTLDQLETRLRTPTVGNRCSICGTINPKTLTACYWCHGPIT